MRKQLTAASIMVGLSTGLSILACGGGIGNNIGGEPCTFDSECPESFVCDGAGSASCVPTCTSDLDCFANEKCETRESDPTIKLCTEDTTGGGDACSTVDDCPNTDDYVCTAGECIEIGGGNTCTTVDDCPNTDDYACEDGTCKSIVSENNPTNPLFVVQIEDVTTGSGCTSTTRGDGDPGSDLTYVALLDAQGTTLGYAEQVDCAYTDNDITNDFSACGHIDGSAPGIDTQKCPEDGVTGQSFDFDTVFSLGCNGYLLAQFLDPNTGVPIPISPGYEIEVGEYGTQCGGSDSDRYQVFLCSDTAGARGQDPSSCTISVGGESTGNVSLEVTTIE